MLDDDRSPLAPCRRLLQTLERTRMLSQKLAQLLFEPCASSLDNLVTLNCAGQVKSGFHGKWDIICPENRNTFSATNTPRDPDGRRGADFWCPRTHNQCVEAVFMDALSELRTVRKNQDYSVFQGQLMC